MCAALCKKNISLFSYYKETIQRTTYASRLEFVAVAGLLVARNKYTTVCIVPCYVIVCIVIIVCR